MAGQQSAPEDTFRTHLGAPSPSSKMIAGLNDAAWAEWRPWVGFPYQAGSGYGNLNDEIIPAPRAQYETYQSLNQWGSNTGKVARATRGKPEWMVKLRYWWTGEVFK